jgi:hypothetical protein
MTTPEKISQRIDTAPDSSEAAQRLAPERQKLAQEVTKDGVKSSTDALSEEMKAKDKAELLALMQKDKVDFKTVEDVEKATEKYSKIMDTWWLDTVLGWIPGGDMASWIFSTLFFLYQWQKLPDGKKLPLKDVFKIFGLQIVDKVGTGAAKVVWAWGWAVAGGLIGTFLIPIPIVGTAAGAALWWVWWYKGGGTLFDYFFKANKWSASIFKKHCDKLKKEAQDRNNTALVQELTASSAKIEQKFSVPSGKEVATEQKKWWKVIQMHPNADVAKAA